MCIGFPCRYLLRKEEFEKWEAETMKDHAGWEVRCSAVPRGSPLCARGGRQAGWLASLGPEFVACSGPEHEAGGLNAELLSVSLSRAACALSSIVASSRRKEHWARGTPPRLRTLSLRGGPLRVRQVGKPAYHGKRWLPTALDTMPRFS